MSDPFCASRCSALCAPGEPCMLTDDGRCLRPVADSDEIGRRRAALDEIARMAQDDGLYD